MTVPNGTVVIDLAPAVLNYIIRSMNEGSGLKPGQYAVRVNTMQEVLRPIVGDEVAWREEPSVPFDAPMSFIGREVERDDSAVMNVTLEHGVNVLKSPGVVVERVEAKAGDSDVLPQVEDTVE